MGKRGQTIIMLSVIVLASLGAHVPALSNGFLNLDDPQILMDNPDIKELSPGSVQKLFRTSYGGLGGYTPLVLVSYALEYRLFGLNPRAFHATNLILHIANSLLVFWLIYLVGGGMGIGFFAAVIFAVHPLHVEPVAWIQGRKDLLFSFFYLSALISYLGFIRKGGSRALYGFSLFLFALSLFSKLAAVSFPLAVLLLERRADKRIDKRAILRSLPFWAMSCLFLVLAFATHVPFFAQTPPPPPGYWQSLGKFFYAFVFYVGKVFAPFRLFPGYADVVGGHPWQAVLSLGLFAALGILIYFAHRRKPEETTFSVGLFVLTLLPTLPFHFFGQPYEDRYMYLPIIGIIVILVGFLPTDALGQRPLTRKNIKAWSLIFIVVALLGLRSWGQGRFWRDSISLWSHVIKSDPRNPIGYINRADALKNEERYAEAMADYDRAQLLLPEDPAVATNRGGVYFKLGKPDKALEELNRALSLDPLFYDGYISRGLFWGYAKEFKNAVLDFTAALKLNRTYQALYYRALAYMEMKEFAKALDDLKAAYSIEPRERVRGLITKLSTVDSSQR